MTAPAAPPAPIRPARAHRQLPPSPAIDLLVSIIRDRGNLAVVETAGCVVGLVPPDALDEHYTGWREDGSGRRYVHGLLEPLSVLSIRCGLHWTLGPSGLRLSAWAESASPLIDIYDGPRLGPRLAAGGAP